MKPNDVAIWERFIDQFPTAYDECEYDVAVGSAPEFDTVVNDENQATADKLYQRKIDVVGWKDGKCHVIELKPRAGTSALGQVRGYVHLYIKEHGNVGPCTPVVITDSLGADMPELAESMGVKLIIV